MSILAAAALLAADRMERWSSSQWHLNEEVQRGMYAAIPRLTFNFFIKLNMSQKYIPGLV